ncbi:hypothetical protein [Photobacterium leiognathi]|uniref:hypothetical protein n=1 Tax=Photobacterium leiognathi TaxID=553611 RepID=UPI002982B1C4|nr:hypothetical protein [Photobacterium leiognathi]
MIGKIISVECLDPLVINQIVNEYNSNSRVLVLDQYTQDFKHLNPIRDVIHQTELSLFNEFSLSMVIDIELNKLMKTGRSTHDYVIVLNWNQIQYRFHQLSPLATNATKLYRTVEPDHKICVESDCIETFKVNLKKPIDCRLTELLNFRKMSGDMIKWSHDDNHIIANNKNILHILKNFML